MLHYILQTLAFQVFFLIIYDVFLKNETFFNWNRAYLIGTAFLSFVLPFLKFESIKAIVPEPMIIRLPEVIIGEVSPIVMDEAMMMQTQQISEQALSFSWTYVWVLGMVLAALILAYKIIKILKMLHENPKRWQGDALIVFLLNSSAAFSFFQYIFLGNNIHAEKKEHIVQHEMVHVKEKHSLDLLAFEILRIVFWFNPLIYMYQNRLSTLHEFIADAKAVKYKGKSEYYQSLLSEVFETQQISFINPFFHQSLIKKRILMLSKSKSKQIHLIKYALLGPVVMVMLMYTSSYASEVKDPFPFLQKEVLYQELTFQELVDKYYKEIAELTRTKGSFNINNEEFFKRDDNYIESREVVARRQAFIKFMYTEIREKKQSEGQLTEADAENYEKRINRFKTYEDYLDFKKTDVAKQGWENMGRNGELRLVVDNMAKLSDDENEMKAEKLALIDKDAFYYKLKMTDGKTTIDINMDKNNSTIIDNIKINKTSSDANDIEVPFATIDEVPLFEGCEPTGSKEVDKDCTSRKVAEFVNKNYNTNLATELGLTGRQRINVIFKIGKDGKVRDVMSRAPHPGLEAEAIRVIKSMPDFTPGKQKGETVTVPYSLPILFQVSEDASGID
ncbi:M56 family metallopeptidase, partial [Gelidibacter sp.]|uniref:M56 family metallopeptidase n=1 Tax=Gelidibacter sp. TaxID=2018083 RepID=UPI0032658820